MAEPYLSQIIMFGGNFTIRGYAACDGQLLSISQYTALFSLLGTTYGGNGQTNFGLPDLRGRVPVSAGRSTGTSTHPQGARYGTERVTLQEVQLPSHSHTLRGLANPGQAADPTNNLLAQGKAGNNDTKQYTGKPVDAAMASQTVGTTGGTQSHDNMMASLVINFQIALQGVYPSRG